MWVQPESVGQLNLLENPDKVSTVTAFPISLSLLDSCGLGCGSGVIVRAILKPSVSANDRTSLRWRIFNICALSSNAGRNIYL